MWRKSETEVHLVLQYPGRSEELGDVPLSLSLEGVLAQSLSVSGASPGSVRFELPVIVTVDLPLLPPQQVLAGPGSGQGSVEELLLVPWQGPH